MTCLLVNQFATPGLGSLMGKRIWEGVVQLTLALVGCVLILIWLGLFVYHSIADQAPQSAAASMMGWLGCILLAGSWLLSWHTSLSLLRVRPAKIPNRPHPYRRRQNRQPPILEVRRAALPPLRA